MPDVTFFFDPACPWTWRASRWLEVVARTRGFEVEWAACSLGILNGEDLPERYRPAVEASSGALRLVEALRAEGRHTDAGRFYGALGEATLEAGEDITAARVRAAAQTAGLGDAVGAIDDPALDAAVRRSTDAAMTAAGPDVGSPVITLPGTERGLHGPILVVVPDDKDALILWDAFEALVRMPAFFEIKRGRG